MNANNTVDLIVKTCMYFIEDESLLSTIFYFKTNVQCQLITNVYVQNTQILHETFYDLRTVVRGVRTISLFFCRENHFQGFFYLCSNARTCKTQEFSTLY